MPANGEVIAVTEKSRGSAHEEPRLVWLMVLRVALISVLLGATLVTNYGTDKALEGISPKFLLGIIAVSYLLTIVYSIWYRTGRHVLLLSRLQLAFDLVLWGSLVYATGGIASGFTFLFDLWVIVAAVVLGGRMALFTAGGGTVILAGLAVSFHLGLIEPLGDQLVTELTIRELVYLFGVNVTALFVVAVLVSSLVARMEHAGAGLERERVQRADLAALHSDVVRSLTVGLATTNLDGDVVGMNPMGLDSLGLEESAVVGLPLARWLPDLAEHLQLPFAKIILSPGVAVRGDGVRFPVEYGLNPLQGADGTVRGSIVSFSDVSQIRSLEKELEASRRMAALGELGASLAHEIRNPLSAISGSFQMLLASPAIEEDDRSLVEIILRETSRIDRLVSDMLHFVRPKPAARLPLNMTALVAEVVRAFTHSPDGRERHVTTEFHGEGRVLADADQMRQLLWNLLRNAVQATQLDGSITVRVQTDQKRTTILEVEDDGVGIGAEQLKLIFDPFYSTRERGLGLGLALCDQIVRAHDAEILAEPGPVRGTVFRVILKPTEGDDDE